MNITDFYNNMKKNHPERKLNFLLVAPRIVHTVGEGYYFQLGVSYVSASMKAAGFNTFALNLNHYDEPIEKILKRIISEHEIDVIATGGLSPQYSLVRGVLETAKRIKPDIISVAGGGIITAEPDIALKALEYADFGVIGEGEITLCELGYALEHGKDPSTVNGIAYYENEEYKQTPKREEIRNLDLLPEPDYEGFELGHYLNLPTVAFVHNISINRVVYMTASRSCPYQCTFCFHSTGNKYRTRSIPNVLDEIRRLKERYNIGFVHMLDELFARKKDRVREFCAAMNEMNLPWAASFRVDDVDQELVDILKDSTCSQMCFGIESADNRILKSMKKFITVEQIDKALKLVNDAGIFSVGNLIFGDIEENLETAKNSLEWWAKHIQYNIDLNLINTFPGSYLYKHACEKGIIKDRVEFLRNGCPQINVTSMNEQELGSMIKDIYMAPERYGKQLINPKAVAVRKGGLLTVSGNCSRCGTQSTWEDMKMFAGNCWIGCHKCNQKHYVPILPIIRKRLIENISKELKSSGKVAVWGVTPFSIGIFDSEPIFRDPNVFIVDNAASKQLITANGKKVNAPSILTMEDISTVINFYPNSFSVLSSNINRTYPHVKKILDVSELIV